MNVYNLIHLFIDEQPKYNKEERNKLFRECRPGRPESPEHKELCDFRDSVKIILQTVNENDYQAAFTFMKPPSKNFKKSVFFPSSDTVVGYFGDYRVALIRTDICANVSYCIKDALKTFKEASFIIGVGVCYAFDRDKYKFGDVLVSKKLSDLRTWNFSKDGEVIDQGEIADVVDDLQSLFCRNME